MSLVVGFTKTLDCVWWGRLSWFFLRKQPSPCGLRYNARLVRDLEFILTILVPCAARDSVRSMTFFLCCTLAFSPTHLACFANVIHVRVIRLCELFVAVWCNVCGWVGNSSAWNYMYYPWWCMCRSFDVKAGKLSLFSTCYYLSLATRVYMCVCVFRQSYIVAMVSQYEFDQRASISRLSAYR